MALQLLSGVIASHMSHSTDYQARQHASTHDALTGLPHRRAFDRRLAAEGARARRYGDESAICAMDLDGFKQINDTFGHAVGDEVLRAVAGHFQVLRGEDEAYRVGGDEFAMVLVGATHDGAYRWAPDDREQAGEISGRLGARRKVTLGGCVGPGSARKLKHLRGTVDGSL